MTLRSFDRAIAPRFASHPLPMKFNVKPYEWHAGSTTHTHTQERKKVEKADWCFKDFGFNDHVDAFLYLYPVCISQSIDRLVDRLSIFLILAGLARVLLSIFLFSSFVSLTSSFLFLNDSIRALGRRERPGMSHPSGNSPSWPTLLLPPLPLPLLLFLLLLRVERATTGILAERFQARSAYRTSWSILSQKRIDDHCSLALPPFRSLFYSTEI